MARETTVTTEWNGKELMVEAMKKMETNAERVGMMLDGAVVRSISKGQAVKRVGNRLVGLSPSKPGKPPHVLHGLLRNSISHRTEIKRGSINVFIGANTPYARRLEYGDPHGPLRGNSRIAARPYLRPAIAKNREKALKRLVKGVFPKNRKGAK
jgi:phage gpG-like protein